MIRTRSIVAITQAKSDGERIGWHVKVAGIDRWFFFAGTPTDYPRGQGPNIGGQAIIEDTEMVDFKRKEDLK